MFVVVVFEKNRLKMPSLREPTISNLKSKNWLALEVIIEENAGRTSSYKKDEL